MQRHCVVSKFLVINLGTCLLIANLVTLAGCDATTENHQPTPSNLAKPQATKNNNEISVTELQAKSVAVVPATVKEFAAQTEAIGFIDFDLEKTVQVFAPYQGKIRKVFAKMGDDVKNGQPLFSIDSPDLVQTESVLITTAGVRALTTKAFDRATSLLEIKAISQKDFDQISSDQQSAEASFNAAKNAVKIFGKTDAELEALIRTRNIDGELRVDSPFSGRITARNAVPGLVIQPGNAPAPFVLADISTKWMIAAVSEYSIPSIRRGQRVSISVAAYPNRIFKGTIVNIGAAVDPNTHRIAVRSEIPDSKYELHPQMLASFIIHSGQPEESIAVPINAIVREGDGGITVFVQSNGKLFTRRPVKLGLIRDGWYQVLEGLSAGENIASDGALFLSNALALQRR